MLEDWRDALISEADLVLYGCNVASGEDGLYFTSELSRITGADVSASTDTTGEDGDWDLEARVGEVEINSIFNSEIDGAYEHTLVDGDIIIDEGFNDDSDVELDDGFDDDDEAISIDSFADVSPEEIRSYAEAGLNFSEVSPEVLATIDFNNIPAEDFQILKDAGLSLNTLSSEALANVNLGVAKNLGHLAQIDLSQTQFGELTTFGELSATFAANADLYTYKAELDIASGLNIDKTAQLSLSDFQAIDYAYLADGALDAEFYLQEYSDVRDDGINPFTHYVQSGQSPLENRYPNRVFKGIAESEEILIASADTDFLLVKDAASTFDESETIEVAGVFAIPVIYFVSGAVTFTLIGLETLRQANSWNEAFDNSNFDYYYSSQPVQSPVDTSTRFPLPNPELEGDNPFTTPETGGNEVETGTPPFDLGEAVRVNVYDFPNANEDIQELLDGQFEFPLEDEPGAYFVMSEGFSDGINETTQNLIGFSDVEDIIENASRPSKEGSETSRGLQAIQKRIDGGDPAYSGFSKTQEDVEQIIAETLGTSNTNPIVKTGKNRNQQFRVDVFNPATGRGVRFVDGKFDTFVNLN